MRFSISALSAALFAGSALCQSPAGYTPFTSDHLGIGYSDVDTIPNTLFNTTAVAKVPSVYSNRSLSGQYIMTLVDLDILETNTTFNLSKAGSLTKGLVSNRTTRIHWFQTNMTEKSTGVFDSNNVTAVASYEGPSPPYGDTPHTYVLYLWAQPTNYKQPKAGLYGNGTNTTRNNFSLDALAAQIGQPVSANYFRVNGSKATTNSTTVKSAAGERPEGRMGTLVLAACGALAFALLL